MAFIQADSMLVPVTFPVGEDGYALVSALTLSLRFQFREDSIHVEEEIFDLDSGNVLHAIGQLSFTNEDGKFWLLKPGKYRTYGLSDSLLAASTEVPSPPQSSTASIQTPLFSRVKVEPGLETIYELSDDSDDDANRIS